jgi:hypothetical protein
MTPRPTGRIQLCGKAEARTRLAHARSFADTAELALGVDDEGSENVAASLAVLAGIAASDASCCAVLGRRARGQDHRDAVVLLAEIAVTGAQMGKDLARLLDVKDNAQYGILFDSSTVAAQSVKWAKRMVVAAEIAVLG